MSDTLAALLLLLVPLRHSKADRRMAKDQEGYFEFGPYPRYGCSVVIIIIIIIIIINKNISVNKIVLAQHQK